VKGFSQIPNAISFNPELTTSERLLWIVLQGFCYGKGECWPSQTTLANIMGLNRQSITRLVKSLCDKGLLVKKSKNGTVTMYSPIVPTSEPNDTVTLPETCIIDNAGLEPASYIMPTRIMDDAGHEEPASCIMPVNINLHHTCDTEEYKNKNKNTSLKKEKCRSPKQNKPKNKKQTNPRMTELRDYFEAKFLKYRNDTYRHGGVKDAMAFKSLLKNYDLEDLKSRIDAYLQDTKSWWVRDKNSGLLQHNITKFAANVNAYKKVKEQPLCAAHTIWRED
jgi:hypothetical protein